MFDEHGLSSPRSAADKQFKTKIIKKVFGTTSKTEIEKMTPSQLTFLKEVLEGLFINFKHDKPIDPLIYVDNYKIEEAA